MTTEVYTVQDFQNDFNIYGYMDTAKIDINDLQVYVDYIDELIEVDEEWENVRNKFDELIRDVERSNEPLDWFDKRYNNEH